MPLQGKQQEALDKWLQEHVGSGTTQCPNCHSIHFTKGELVKLSLANPYDKNHFSETLLMRVCANCNYVNLISAKGIGII